jgi:hypothetical protein
MRIRSVLSHSAQAVVEGALIATLVVGLVAGTAFAAKGGGAPTSGGKHGGGGSSGSFSLILLDSTDGVAHLGQRVTFDVSTSASTPYVGVRCYQDSTWVYDAYVGFFAGYLFDPWLTMNSGYWVAGDPASCNARLFTYDSRGRENVMATSTFAVAP